MSWLFSRALVEEYSEANSLDGTPSAPSNTTPTPQAFLWRDKTTDAWNRFPSGMTCEPLTESRGEELLTWFRAGFLAPTLVAPARAPELTEKTADFGPKCPELLATLDLDLYSWKTRQCLPLAGLDECLQTFPAWGLTRSGELFQQKTSERLKSAQDFGLLRDKLREQQQSAPMKDGSVNGAEWRCLKDAAVTTANGNAASATSGLTRFIMKNGTVAPSVVPEMWLTPQANEDAAGTPAGKMQKMLGNHPLIRGTTPEQWATGTLNPNWTEWLNGFPVGWTDISASATPKFQQWLLSHGVCSEGQPMNKEAA
jgi:hypothetical protein